MRSLKVMMQKTVKSVSRSLVYLKMTLYWTHSPMPHDWVISISIFKASAFLSTCWGVIIATDEFALPVPGSIDSAACWQYLYLLLEALGNLLQGDRVSVNQASQPKIKNIMESFPLILVSFVSSPKQGKMPYNAFSHFSDHLPIRLDR